MVNFEEREDALRRNLLGSDSEEKFGSLLDRWFRALFDCGHHDSPPKGEVRIGQIIGFRFVEDQDWMVTTIGEFYQYPKDRGIWKLGAEGWGAGTNQQVVFQWL